MRFEINENVKAFIVSQNLIQAENRAPVFKNDEETEFSKHSALVDECHRYCTHILVIFLLQNLLFSFHMLYIVFEFVFVVSSLFSGAIVQLMTAILLIIIFIIVSTSIFALFIIKIYFCSLCGLLTITLLSCEILSLWMCALRQDPFYKRTALHIAAKHGQVNTVQALLRAGADANIPDIYGEAENTENVCHHNRLT